MMSYTVRELPKAKSDKRSILAWLLERSPPGVAAWLNAYDNLVELLRDDADQFGEAFENRDCLGVEVKQAFFKTRRGRVYRMLVLFQCTRYAFITRRVHVPLQRSPVGQLVGFRIHDGSHWACIPRRNLTTVCTQSFGTAWIVRPIISATAASGFACSIGANPIRVRIAVTGAAQHRTWVSGRAFI